MDQMRIVLGIKNLHWNDADQSVMIADVLFEGMETAGYAAFVISSNDVTAHGRDLWAKANAGDYGEIGPYVAPAPEIEDYRLAIDAHVNATARSRDYNDAATLAGYVASTVPTWTADASAFVAWRDAVWVHTFTELDKVMTGQRPQPSVEDFIAELPAIVWPA